jgi:hypothetical protein
MLARNRRKIVIASATAAVIVGAFAAVSANSESSQSLGLVQSAVLPESIKAPEPQSSMAQTAVVAEPRGPARSADSRRRVAQNVRPPPQNVAPPRVPLILGIRH